MTNIVQNADRLYSKVSDLLKTAHDKVLQTLNTTMIATYFEIVRMIVEEGLQAKSIIWRPNNYWFVK